MTLNDNVYSAPALAPPMPIYMNRLAKEKFHRAGIIKQEAKEENKYFVYSTKYKYDGNFARIYKPTLRVSKFYVNVC